VKLLLAILLPVILTFFPPTVPSSLAAGRVAVTGAHITPTQDRSRLVLDLNGPANHQVFALEGPDRLVIDIADATCTGKLPKVDGGDPILTGMRSGVRGGNDLRIVLDLKRAVRVKSHLQTSGTGQGQQLVLDLIPKGMANSQAGIGTGTGPGSVAAGSRPAAVPSQPAPRGKAASLRPMVVAIDAGHGGQDPGAIGARGTREKDVTLAIARRLAGLVAKEPGLRPLLIRDDDRFVPLRARINKARKHKADLFISIHADAFDNPSAQGSSVFTLSRRGASSEAAKWLADRENSADKVGGVDLGDRDDQLATVLLDMVQNAAQEHSAHAAGAVLKNLSRLGAIHKNEVQKAGFVVLKSPDIPSLLVETAFITNPAEEARLVNGTEQQRLAAAILGGIRQYQLRYRQGTAARPLTAAAKYGADDGGSAMDSGPGAAPVQTRGQRNNS
jgi:N-acetylmuramoyl-L-alanine amidase